MVVQVPLNPYCHPHTPPEGFPQNLEDLLDLADSVEKVVWPTGLDAFRAKEFVVDYNKAIQVCRAHRGKASSLGILG